jgi:nitrile hydratase beta subunit
MNGVHDMGGLECFGSIDTSPAGLFHADWEKQVLALSLAIGATGTWNLDQSRFARESLEPSEYLSIGYYRIWLNALETLLLEHNLITTAELTKGKSLEQAKPVKRVLRASDVAQTLSRGGPTNRDVKTRGLYHVGDKVRVRNMHTSTHTRLPAYVRNHTGVIHCIHGAHVYPDSNAMGQGENPQWLYNVKFSARELWGERRDEPDVVHVDCWEPYLEIQR